MKQIKVGLLGSGLFMQQIKKSLKTHFTLTRHNPKIWIVANYGRILKAKELESGKFLNVHASLLPKYKGASPIQSAIIAGEKKTGFSIIEMDEKIDHGPIIIQEQIEITLQDNYQTLAKKISKASAKALIKIIPLYLKGKVNLRTQNDYDKYWTTKITGADRLISNDIFKNDPQKAQRIVRALFPRPKAYISIGGKRLIIQKACIKNNYFYPCVVQLEGKKSMAWPEFLRGWRKNIPKILTEQ